MFSDIQCGFFLFGKNRIVLRELINTIRFRPDNKLKFNFNKLIKLKYNKQYLFRRYFQDLSIFLNHYVVRMV